MTELSAHDLGKRFGRRIIFRRLNLSVQGGQSLAVTGPNGSGKSTLVRILAGVMRSSKGTVTLTVDDQIVPEEDRPFSAGLVAPYLDVYDGFSPRENLAFIARSRSLKDADRRIEAALERVELGSRADDLVETFSSGMKQRMRFAAALITEPPVLFLDEPTSNLDGKGIQAVRTVMRQCVDEGRILVVATNDPGEAAACDAEVSILDFQ